MADILANAQHAGGTGEVNGIPPRDLAELLYITDRAVSIRERGLGVETHEIAL